VVPKHGHGPRWDIQAAGCCDDWTNKEVQERQFKTEDWSKVFRG